LIQQFAGLRLTLQQQSASACHDFPYFTAIHMKVDRFCTGFCTTDSVMFLSPPHRNDLPVIGVSGFLMTGRGPRRARSSRP
jgi:hypothetical protein